MPLRGTKYQKRPGRGPIEFRTLGELVFDYDARHAVGDGSMADISVSEDATGEDVLAGDGDMADDADWEQDGSGVLEVADGVMTLHGNDAPVITSSNAFGPAENQTAIATLTATDANEEDVLTWSKQGGADAALFGLTTGGVLTFAVAPNFEAPTDANADGVYLLTVRVTDQHGAYDEMTLSVTVTNVNEAPINAVPGAQSTNENVSKAITGISVADVDTGTFSITLSVTNGALTLAQTTGLTFTLGDGTADASMAFSGTAANVNAALATVTYIPTTDYSGSALLTLISSDGALSDNDTVAITVVADERQDLVWSVAWVNGLGYWAWNGETSDDTPVLNTTDLLAFFTAQGLGLNSSNLTITAITDGLRFRFKGALGGSDQPTITWASSTVYPANDDDHGQQSISFTQRTGATSDKQAIDLTPAYPTHGSVLIDLPAPLTDVDGAITSEADAQTLINASNPSLVTCTDVAAVGKDRVQVEFTGDPGVDVADIAVSNGSIFGPPYIEMLGAVTITHTAGTSSVPEVPGSAAQATYYVAPTGSGQITLGGTQWWDYDANFGMYNGGAGSLEAHLNGLGWTCTVMDVGSGSYVATRSTVGSVGSAPYMSDGNGSNQTAFTDGSATVPAIPAVYATVDIVRNNFTYASTPLMVDVTRGGFSFMNYVNVTDHAAMGTEANAQGFNVTASAITNGTRFTSNTDGDNDYSGFTANCKHDVTVSRADISDGGPAAGAFASARWYKGKVGRLSLAAWTSLSSIHVYWDSTPPNAAAVSAQILAEWGFAPESLSITDEGATWRLDIGFNYADGDWPGSEPHVVFQGGDSASTAPFSPDLYSGLRNWWEPTELKYEDAGVDPTELDDLVRRWVDKASSKIAEQATSGQRPTDKGTYIGVNAASGTELAHTGDAGSIGGANGVVLVEVYFDDYVTANKGIAARDYGAGTEWRLLYWHNYKFIHVGTFNGSGFDESQADGNSPVPAATWCVVGFRYNHVAQTIELIKNGVVVATQGSRVIGAAPSAVFSVPTNSAGMGWFTGRLGRVLVYNTLVSDAKLLKLYADRTY